MDKKLKKDILKILKDFEYACEFNKLKQILIDKYHHERVVEGHLDIFSSKVLHILSVLENDGFVKKEQGHSGGISKIYYSLYSNGYAEFDPWYKKGWRFFTNDFAKLLSIVATALSIIAIIVSLTK